MRPFAYDAVTEEKWRRAAELAGIYRLPRPPREYRRRHRDSSETNNRLFYAREIGLITMGEAYRLLELVSVFLFPGERR